MELLFANKPSVLLLLGIAMMIFILMRRWHRYYKKQKPAPHDARRRASAASADGRQPLMDAPPELLRWQVEMHETARDLTAELDTKIAVLQRLVIDARREAERLEAVVQRAENAS